MTLFQPASSATPLAVLMAVQLLAVSDDPHPSQLTPPHQPKLPTFFSRHKNTTTLNAKTATLDLTTQQQNQQLAIE